jgi:hypothetical protein
MKPVLAILIIVCALWLRSATGASLWVETGDATLRHDIEVLANYGLIDGPITTWPIPWRQVTRHLTDDSEKRLPAYVQRSVDRVLTRFGNEQRALRLRVGFVGPGENQLKPVQDFRDPLREGVNLQAALNQRWKSTYLNVSLGYWEDNDGDVKLDDSYIAQMLGNWVLYAGFVDDWWGPGWGGSLIMSNNARPFPKIGITRVDPRAFGTRLLSWLGPWQLNLFLGTLEESGRVVENPLVPGIRLALRPWRAFEIGFSRVLMICGDGRPCDFGTWVDALLPLNDVDNTKSQDDPSNQLAGIDGRLSTRVRDLGISAYGQYVGEDEHDLWITAAIAMFGFSLDGPLSSNGAQWRIVGEYHDTAADGLDPRSTLFNLTYQHDIYVTGYTYRGRPIGHSLGADSRQLSVMGTIIDTRNWTYGLRYHYAYVNVDGECAGTPSGSCPHTASSSAEKINVVEAGVVLRTRLGEFLADAWWQDNGPDTPESSEADGGFVVRWQMWY